MSALEDLSPAMAGYLLDLLDMDGGDNQPDEVSREEYLRIYRHLSEVAGR